MARDTRPGDRPQTPEVLREQDQQDGRTERWYEHTGPCDTPMSDGTGTGICLRCGWQHA